jgi:hypothetical protein
VDALGDLEQRLASGERVWHWLHDNPEWGEFTLLFISLHREDESVIAGLWEVWDDGSGIEDPVTFRSSDPDGKCGSPNHRLDFPDLPSALKELSVHGVTADGFGDYGQLIAKYGEAVRVRPPQSQGWQGSAVAILDPDADR